MPNPEESYYQSRARQDIQNNSLDTLRNKYNQNPETLGAPPIPGENPPAKTPNGPPAQGKLEEGVKYLGSEALKFFQLITSPYEALTDFVLAPLASENHNNMTISESFKTAFGAAADELTDPLSEDRPEYGNEIANRLDVSDELKPAIGTTIELLANPIATMGPGAILTARKGLEAGVRNQDPNIWTQGLKEVLGAVENPEVSKLARLADSGDEKSVKALADALDSPEVKDVIESKAGFDIGKHVEAVSDTFSRGLKTAAKLTPIDKNLKPKEVKKIIESSIYTNTPTHTLKLNLNRINASDDIESLVSKSLEKYRNNFLKSTRGVDGDVLQKNQLSMLGDLIGHPPKDMSALDAYTLRQLLISSGDDLKNYARIITEKGASEPERLRFYKAAAIHKNLQSQAMGIKDDSLISVFNIAGKTPQDSFLNIRRARNFLQSNPRQAELLQEMVGSLDKPLEINQLVSKLGKSSTDDVLFEWYINAILSGPITHATNIVSNASTLLMRPAETSLKLVSATAMADRKAMKTYSGDLTAEVTGIMDGVSDLFKLITRNKSWEYPEALSARHELRHREFMPAISSANMNIPGKPGEIIDFIGNHIIQQPGKLLLKEDRAFKLLHYRMSVNKAAIRRATREANSTTEFKVLKQQYRNNPTDEDLIGVINDTEYFTFTNELGKLGKDWKKVTSSNRFGRWIVPFFDTPTNIVKFGTRHSVFGNVFKDLKHIAEPGPLGHTARAKMAIGTGIPAAIMSSMGDNITGRIDETTPLGKFMRGNGHPPYSIKVGDTWISYERIEPLRTILGLATSYREAIDNVDWKEEENIDLVKNLTGAFIAPFLAITSDNYMFPQLGKVFYALEAAMSGNDHYAYKQINGILTSMAVPNIVPQLLKRSGLFDNTIRQSEDYIDVLRSRIPGLASDLPAHVNLWGDDIHIPPGLGPDIISPIFTHKEGDPIDDEIIRLKLDLPGDLRSIQGVKLNSSQRALVKRLTGKGLEGMPPLKAALIDFISSPQYQTSSDGWRKYMLEYNIQLYRDIASDFLVSQDKQLQQMIEQRSREKMEAIQP